MVAETGPSALGFGRLFFAGSLNPAERSTFFRNDSSPSWLLRTVNLPSPGTSNVTMSPSGRAFSVGASTRAAFIFRSNHSRASVIVMSVLAAASSVDSRTSATVLSWVSRPTSPNGSRFLCCCATSRNVDTNGAIAFSFLPSQVAPDRLNRWASSRASGLLMPDLAASPLWICVTE